MNLSTFRTVDTGEDTAAEKGMAVALVEVMEVGEALEAVAEVDMGL